MTFSITFLLMRLFAASNAAVARSFIIFFLFVFSSIYFAQNAYAATTPFRSAKIVTTDGIVPFTNLGNCSFTDGQTCDRVTNLAYANLYFQDFGNYNDFGMPLGSTITKVRMRVTGKVNEGIYVGLSLQIPAQSNCQFPSDLWTLGQLIGQTIKVQNFVTNVTLQGGSQVVSWYCLQPANLENKAMTWRIDYYSPGVNWSANIDNFEIAFDFDPGATPTPTPTPTPIPTPTPTPKTPLILIPGIGGSELKTTQTTIWDQPDGHGGTFSHIYPAETVWVNNFEAGLPGDDDYFDVLRMFNDGQTSQANLALTGNLFDGYKETINFFVANGYTLNKDFFVFPYDWRKDISLAAPLLDQKINSIKQQTGAAKVDIIAHSMGGLVARNYIADAGRASNVRKLFTLGTPHLGSVKFLSAIKYGICLKFEIGPACLSIAPSEAKDVLQNMISGYELAPSQEYFDFYNNQDKDHLYPYQNNSQPLNYDQIKSFLTSLSYNTSLFTPSESFHALDSSLVNANGVDITNIAGSGLPTLGQIIEKSVKDFFGNIVQKKDDFTINGDKTVPLFSASLIDSGRNKSLLGNAKVFYTRQEHGNLVASGSALNLVKNILAGNSQLPDGVSAKAYSLSNGWLFSKHSPVNMNIYDSLGNHTGPTDDGFETNIPGSSYDTLDDAAFIFIPNNGNYNIKFEATDQGSFDFKIRKFENDTISQDTLYKDIPLTNSTKAETQFDTSSIVSPIIHLDKDGNGTVDKDISPSSNLTGNAVFDQTPPNTDIQLSGILGNNGWYKSDVIVTLTAQDEVSGSGILKTEYSLDNGINVNTYTRPFAISTEKINKLKFRSIDKAGNEENPKEAGVKIDKTPPEAKIFIDQDKQDLVVTGVDANPTTVVRSDNTLTKKKDDAFYYISDEAGNSLKLDVRERDKEKQDRFRIYSIQYNNGPIKILEDNHFNVSYNGKKERANVKEQNFELKGEVRIRIQYDAKKNKSTIIVKESKQEKVKEVRSGLVLLQLLINRGQLNTNY